MSRRSLPAAALAVGVTVVACFEISGPATGLSAISTIRPAWPAVVVGDALRDSEGDTAALLVEAYGGDGEPVTDAEVRFIPLDRGLHVTTAGVVIGDSIRNSARIIAQVSRGGDVLQTPEISIDVVPLPDSVAPTAAETTFTAKPIPVADPDPIQSDSLKVKVMHKGTAGSAPAPVKSWIVQYEILAPLPPGVGGQRTVLFVGDTGMVVSDTTDASGVATRRIALQRALLMRVDPYTIDVRATIRRIGTANETRTVLFRVPFVPE